MESPLSFFRMHWDHEPLTAWSPGFSRSKPFEPPKGGTPNQPWFMESPFGLATVHWDPQPTRPPSSSKTNHPIEDETVASFRFLGMRWNPEPTPHPSQE